jgi:hypothetical protein
MYVAHGEAAREGRMRSIEIARREGERADYVDASLDDDGALRVMRNSFGPGDYETEVTAIVFAEDVERLLEALLAEARRPLPGATDQADRGTLLLQLVKQRYAGNTGAVEDFTSFAQSRGIEVGWFRWP